MANQYEKISTVGSGTFGQVHLVRHLASGRRYVIKEVSVAGMTEKTRTQTLTEVEVLARCRHINVIRYKETFIHNACLCIAMAFAEGGDLHAKILNQHGVHFNEPIILDWFVQICFGLRYIHSMNILHRDLKTHNIFLTGDSIIKIGDFGIARILSDTSELASTAVGTPYYLSPEICQQLPYNYKSDMWSAGCVLYELCSLTPPFDGPNFAALVIRILNGTYERIPSQYSSVLEDLVSVLLRGDAASRPSADQVLWVPALQDYVKGHVARTSSLASKQRQPSPASLPQARKRPSGSEEKENINPTLGVVKTRRSSLGTPKTEALHMVDNKRVVNSAGCLRKTPQKIKSAAPTLSLYKEVLRRAIKKSPQVHQRRERLSALAARAKNQQPGSSRTYTVHRDPAAKVTPGGIGNKSGVARVSPIPGERSNQSYASPRSTAANPSPPSARIISKTPTNENISPVKPRKILESKGSAAQSKTQRMVGQGKTPLKSDNATKEFTKYGAGFESKVEGSKILDPSLYVMYAYFCKDQSKVYPLMEGLRCSLEEALGADHLERLHNVVGESLVGGIPLEGCVRDMTPAQVQEMPRLLQLLQLEAMADM